MLQCAGNLKRGAKDRIPVMIRNDLLLRAARREKTERTPVWMMRQAGRTDPQYRELRRREDRPLEELFRDPQIAAEVSLMPRRIGVDAIIFFQDILTPLWPMGAEFLFRPGPVLDSPIRTPGEIDALTEYDPADKLGFVTETLRHLRTELAGELPLLGFAGAPLTLALFMIEGKSPGRDAPHGHSMMRDDPAAMHRLLKKLADMTVDYLSLQIEAGADAVQLFESCADLLSPREYEEFAHPYHVHVFSKLGGRAPTILFAKEQARVDLMAASGADVLSLGSSVDLADARRQFGDRVALQGNVDNRIVMEGSPDRIDEAVRRCIEQGRHEGHILNLNHGLLQDTPFENVCRFVETAKATILNPPPRAAVRG